jgi:hypothetical protein
MWIAVSRRLEVAWDSACFPVVPVGDPWEIALDWEASPSKMPHPGGVTLVGGLQGFGLPIAIAGACVLSCGTRGWHDVLGERAI